MRDGLIRDGNHFIQLGNKLVGDEWQPSKWALIDGPWFDYLERNMPDSHYQWRFAEPPTVQYKAYNNDLPEYMEAKYIVWTKEKWHSGYTLEMWNLSRYELNVMEYLRRRVHICFVCEGGIIPATINSKEPSE